MWTEPERVINVFTDDSGRKEGSDSPLQSGRRERGRGSAFAALIPQRLELIQNAAPRSADRGNKGGVAGNGARERLQSDERAKEGEDGERGEQEG